MGGHAHEVAERIRARADQQSTRQSASANPSTDNLAETGSAIEALVDMLVGAGGHAAHIAATLIDLPDVEDAPATNIATLYVSAESSANRTNGTVDVAARCLPSMKRVTVEGNHFNFIDKSSDEIAEHASTFFADIADSGSSGGSCPVS
jgi:hypothetical protein